MIENTFQTDTQKLCEITADLCTVAGFIAIHCNSYRSSHNSYHSNLCSSFLDVYSSFPLSHFSLPSSQQAFARGCRIPAPFLVPCRWVRRSPAVLPRPAAGTAVYRFCLPLVAVPSLMELREASELFRLQAARLLVEAVYCCSVAAATALVLVPGLDYRAISMTLYGNIVSVFLALV